MCCIAELIQSMSNIGSVILLLLLLMQYYEWRIVKDELVKIRWFLQEIHEESKKRP